MLKKICKKIIFEIQMFRMDMKWYGQLHCWEMYPPSFYYRYTPKEQEEIRSKEIAEIRAMLREYEDKHKLMQIGGRSV